MKVVIIGGIHHNTLGVIRSIGSEGISSEDIALFIVDELQSQGYVFVTVEEIMLVS